MVESLHLVKLYIIRTKSRVTIDTEISKFLVLGKHTKLITQRKHGKELGEKEPLKEGNHLSDAILQIVTKGTVVAEIVGRTNRINSSVTC